LLWWCLWRGTPTGPAPLFHFCCRRVCVCHPPPPHLPRRGRADTTELLLSAQLLRYARCRALPPSEREPRALEALAGDFEHHFAALCALVPSHVVLERCIDVECYRCAVCVFCVRGCWCGGGGACGYVGVGIGGVLVGGCADCWGAGVDVMVQACGLCGCRGEVREY
jgi:hypothetical protein